MKYIENKNIVNKYKRYHDLLTRLLHSRQAYDNFQREEVQQDNDLYSINHTIHTIVNIKYHKKL